MVKLEMPVVTDHAKIVSHTQVVHRIIRGLEKGIRPRRKEKKKEEENRRTPAKPKPVKPAQKRPRF
jgi:hypothetical protein